METKAMTSPAALKAAEEVKAHILKDWRGRVAISSFDVELFAAIIAKHFPSPVAAEGDVERLRAALREWAIPEPPNGASWVKCRMCGEMWDGRDEGEKHKPNCLAALSAQPASVGGGVPEGWQLVPKRPADEMLTAGYNAISKYLPLEYRGFNAAEELYRAMLAASPTAIEPQAGWRDANKTGE